MLDNPGLHAAADPCEIRKPRNVLLLANANSRGGGALDTARAVLEKQGLTVSAHRTESRNELTPLIEEHGRGMDCVVAAGGDGTMNGIADGIIQCRLPLGVLPMGTANDLARTLGIPTDLDAAAAVIAAGRVKRIDLGEVNEHAFFNVASIGLSAELAAGLTPERKRRFGRLAYAMTALNVLARARPFHATIVAKNGAETNVRSLQIAIGNGRYYGGGMAVRQDAKINDGTLDFYSLEVKSVWKLALMLRSFRSGSHGLWREVRTERGESFEVRTRRPRPVNTDGDLITFTPARFTVRPEAIAVFVP